MFENILSDSRHARLDLWVSAGVTAAAAALPLVAFWLSMSGNAEAMGAVIARESPPPATIIRPERPRVAVRSWVLGYGRSPRP